MRFNVPFLPDSNYMRFLVRHRHRLAACHFSLYTSEASDARVRLREVPTEKLIEGLQTISGPEKLLLINARFHDPDQLSGTTALRPLLKRLEQLLDAEVLDGLVFADFYFLNALAVASPRMAADLQAVFGINFMIDTPARLDSLMEALAATPFKTPSHVPLDRSLNRDGAGRLGLMDHIRRCYPKLRPELLVNEGCLLHCPYKPAHDAYIALANCCRPVDTHTLNREYGCLHTVMENPSVMLRSPFIRPEDTAACGGATTIIKLCGRTLGPAFLERTLAAYFDGCYRGNLLDLLDTLNPMADVWNLPNQDLDEATIHHLDTCDKHCRTCTLCRERFERIAVRRPPAIPSMGTDTVRWRGGLS